MGRDHPDLADMLKESLREEGINLIEECGVESISKKAGVISLTLADGRIITASDLLVAVGRRPNIQDLHLEAASIRTRPQGIITDDRLRTSNKRIFAIGDVAGRQQFTHIANYHASIIIRNMLFKIPAKVSDKAVPWVTYTDPELAHVGLSEDEAIQKYGEANIRRLRWSLSENDRARAELRTSGKLCVTVHKKGQILGASILAPSAGEMITAWSLAISSGLKISAMASFIAPYPTYGEASKRIAGSYFTDKLFSPKMRAIVKRLVRL